MRPQVEQAVSMGEARAPMVKMLENSDATTREAAAAHLALLTKYDFGQDAAKWREWETKRIQGLVEQAVEDREDQARRLKLHYDHIATGSEL